MNATAWHDGCVWPGPSALPEACDVVVVGAGLAGAMAALTLAQAGVDVVWLDAQDGPGRGATGRCLGHVGLGLLEQPIRTIRAIGEAKAMALFQICTDNAALLTEHGLLEPGGGVWAAVDDREAPVLQESYAALVRNGHDAALLSAELVAQHTGIQGLSEGLCFGLGGRVSPVQAIGRLADKAIAAGARVFGQCKAQVVGAADGGLGVQVGDRIIGVEAVIVAAGAQSGEVSLSLKSGLKTVREQALCTEPLSRVLPGAHRAGQGYTAWRQVPDGGVAVSGCRWATPHLETGETEPKVVPVIQEALERFVRSKIDQDVAIAKRWSWIWATGKDGLPLVGRMPGDARVLACVGFGSTAWSFEAAAGRAVAQGLLTGESGLPTFIGARRLLRWR